MIRVSDDTSVDNPYIDDDPRPWSEDSRSADKDRIAKFIVLAGGVTTGGAAREVLSHTQREFQTERDFVYNFFNDHTGILAVIKATEGKNRLYAHPTPLLVHLVLNEIGISGDEFSRIYHTEGDIRDKSFLFEWVPPKSIRAPPRVLDVGKGISELRDTEWFRARYPEKEFYDQSRDWDRPKDRVRRRAEKSLKVDSDSTRKEYARVLDWDISWKREQMGHGGGQFRSKYTDARQAGKPYAKVSEGIENAARLGYRVGTVVTLTTAKEYFSSFVDALHNLRSSRQKLIDNLRRKPMFDGAPDRVGVLQITDSGLPHLHIFFPGISPPDFPGDWVKNYWDSTAEQAEQVKIQWAWWCPDQGAPDEAGAWIFGENETPIRDYFVEIPRLFLDVGRDNRSVLSATKRGGDHWKLSLLWAVETQVHFMSQSLRGNPEISIPSDPHKVPDHVRQTSVPVRGLERDAWLRANASSQSQPVPDWIDNPTTTDEQHRPQISTKESRITTSRDEWLKNQAAVETGQETGRLTSFLQLCTGFLTSVKKQLILWTTNYL